MKENEFDLDFDFEKEYGFDLKDEDKTEKLDDDFDLRAILESDFAEEAELFNAEYQNDFDYGPEEYPLEEEPAAEPEPAPVVEEPAAAEEPEVEYGFDDDLIDMSHRSIEQMMEEDDLAMEEEYPEEDVPPMEELPEAEEETPVRQRRERKAPKERWNPLKYRPAPKPEAPKAESSNTRKKPVSKMRQFKNEVLPLLIIGVAAVLILFFVIGAGSRAIGNVIRNNKDRSEASESMMNEEERLALEAQTILDEAALLAAGYDYEAAIAKLETYSGNISEHSEITMQLSTYRQAQSTLISHNDPGSIPNLSFQLLIADPSRAFTNQKLGGQYNRNFVTVDEFQKILESLYDRGYVLVEMEHCIAETVTGDTVTYSAKPILLPDGKKPVMITETMVNYYDYMIDGNGDGVPDKDGAGFASKLVVDDLTGKIQAEMVNAAGETVRGDYDLVPILEKFIEQHPDFSYRGARAILAVTGDEGIFGYRITSTAKASKGEAFYNKEVEGAKKIVSALREKGYEIACYTYANVDYGKKSASDIQADISSWKVEIMPVVGTLDTLVYAKSSDISATGTYSGGKYNVLKEAGFRYFISNGTSPSADVTSEYVRQKRIMVTGTYMAHTPTLYNYYFDAKAVLNSTRGNVPQ